MLPVITKVLIIGAGPSGLALGATLAAKGIDCVLIDRLAEGQNTSRALGIHAHTLEVLETIGVTPLLIDAGLKVPVFKLYDRDKALLILSFADLPTRYPYVLMLPQNETEAILARRVEQFGGKVHRLHEAVDMRQDADGVDIDIRLPDGLHKKMRARYVVGADGYHSLVRERAGIGFHPGTYAQSFILGDVRMDWPFPVEEVQLFLSPSGLMVVAPFSRGNYRIVATLDHVRDHVTREDLQAVLSECGPQRTPVMIDELKWSSRFRIHHGVAACYRTGHAFLIGDAAHVHSPAGGQGMNIGIQDACDFGDRLASVLQGNADESLLDKYEVTRRPIAERVVSLTDRLTRIATVKGPIRQEFRNVAIEVVDHLPWVQQKIAMQLAELHN